MPSLRPNGFPETSTKILLRKIRPDDSRALQARHVRDLRVDFDFAVVLSELELFLRAEVLITEEDDASLCDQEGELDFFRGGEEGCFVLVGAGAGVDVFAVCVADGVDVLEEEGAGWAVLWWCWSVDGVFVVVDGYSVTG
jgi:hypothetical protein